MTEKTIHIKIITPEKIVYEDDADAVYAKGISGSFGILPDHIPFMSVLDIGIVKVEKSGQGEKISVMGGTFQFKNNEAIILTEAAERGTDIDTARAKLAKERAEAILGSSATINDIKMANAALARAMARLKAASKG